MSETRWVLYRCRATATIRIGYTQVDGPTLMPFMGSGRENAKVGTVTVPLR